MTAPVPPDPPAGSRRLLQPLALWCASRAVLFAAVLAGSLVLHGGPAGPAGARSWPAWILDRFTWADSFHYLRIAAHGYRGRTCCDQAFFPGYPVAVRAVAALLGGPDAAAGLAVAVTAGAAAAVLLYQLARDWAPPGPVDEHFPRRAVTYLVLAPYGLFLSVVYSDSLFLACAVGAWWAGHRGRWWAAGLLAAAATVVRVNGLFLGVALVVMYLTRPRDGRRIRLDAVALLGPLAGLVAVAGYLHQVTGSWNAWSQAETRGWHRSVAPPWTGLSAGWRAAWHPAPPSIVVSHWADLAAVAVGAVLVVLLLRQRRWPDTVYLGLNLAVLVCSTTLVSSARYAALWFPGYLLAARYTAGPRRLRLVLLVAGAAGLVGLSLVFADHQWVD